MKKLSVLIALILMGCNSESDTVSLEHSPFSSTNINATNDDIIKVVQATQGVDIVGVGEASHQGSKAYSYKSRIAKALHQEGELEFIAFEAGLYDGLAAWQNYATGQQRLIEAITGPDANYMYGHRYSVEVQGMMDYINDQVTTDNPLMLVGYDSRINSDPGCSVMFDELESYLNQHGLITFDYQRIKTLAPIMMCPWYHSEKYDNSKHNELVNLVAQLVDTLTLQKSTETVPNYDATQSRDFRQYASFWLQIAKSLRAHAYFQINNIDNSYTNDQSADNLRWLLEEWFEIKGQTLIWAHNIHATPVKDSVIEAIQTRYPDVSTYNIMQLTYTGLLAANTHISEDWADSPEPYQAERGTMNHTLYRSDIPDSYIDLNSLTGEQKAFVDSPQTIRYHFGDLETLVPSSIMDGIIFIREETPAVAR